MKSTEIKKVSTTFYTPMFTSFEGQLGEAFIKRDAFLDHVIDIENPTYPRGPKGKAELNQGQTLYR